MQNLHAPRFTALATAVAALVSASAQAQQNAPVYNPPPYIIVAPTQGGQNPYLMYVPAPEGMNTPMTAPGAPAMPQTMPAPPQTLQTPPQTPPTPQATDAPEGPTLSDLGKSLRNYFTEDELDLLFDYMKESVVAAFKGEDVYLPPDLAFKLEILLVRLQKEGGQYMDNLVKQLERDLKRSLKEKLGPDGQPAPPPAALPPTEPAAVKPATPAPPAMPTPGNSSKLQVPKKTARKG